MADAIVINKADGDNTKKAELTKTEYQKILHPAQLLEQPEEEEEEKGNYCRILPELFH